MFSLWSLFLFVLWWGKLDLHQHTQENRFTVCRASLPAPFPRVPPDISSYRQLCDYCQLLVYCNTGYLCRQIKYCSLYFKNIIRASIIATNWQFVVTFCRFHAPQACLSLTGTPTNYSQFRKTGFVYLSRLITSPQELQSYCSVSVS